MAPIPEKERASKFPAEAQPWVYSQKHHFLKAIEPGTAIQFPLGTLKLFGEPWMVRLSGGLKQETNYSDIAGQTLKLWFVPERLARMREEQKKYQKTWGVKLDFQKGQLDLLSAGSKVSVLLAETKYSRPAISSCGNLYLDNSTRAVIAALAVLDENSFCQAAKNGLLVRFEQALSIIDVLALPGKILHQFDKTIAADDKLVILDFEDRYRYGQESVKLLNKNDGEMASRIAPVGLIVNRWPTKE